MARKGSALFIVDNGACNGWSSNVSVGIFLFGFFDREMTSLNEHVKKRNLVSIPQLQRVQTVSLYSILRRRDRHPDGTAVLVTVVMVIIVRGIIHVGAIITASSIVVFVAGSTVFTSSQLRQGSQDTVSDILRGIISQ